MTTDEAIREFAATVRRIPGFHGGGTQSMSMQEWRADVTPTMRALAKARKERLKRMMANAVPDHGIDLRASKPLAVNGLKPTRVNPQGPEPLPRHMSLVPLTAIERWKGFAAGISALSRSFVASPNPELAAKWLDRADERRYRTTILEIKRAVGFKYGLSQTEFMSKRRVMRIVYPRQIAMYLAKIITPHSLPEIGRRFGGRDHTTVLHAVRKIGALRQTDAELNAELNAFVEQLGGNKYEYANLCY